MSSKEQEWTDYFDRTGVTAKDIQVRRVVPPIANAPSTWPSAPAASTSFSRPFDPAASPEPPEPPDAPEPPAPHATPTPPSSSSGGDDPSLMVIAIIVALAALIAFANSDDKPASHVPNSPSRNVAPSAHRGGTR